MRRNLAKLALFLAVQTFQTAWPQAVTGSIFGSVSDDSGAVVASARLTLVNAGTGAQRAIVTNDAGQFVISSVDPGRYSRQFSRRA